MEEINISVKTNIGESGDKLSGGEKQRVGIARLYYNMRNLLIFDESMNAIDIKNLFICLRSKKKIKFFF